MIRTNDDINKEIFNLIKNTVDTELPIFNELTASDYPLDMNRITWRIDSTMALPNEFQDWDTNVGETEDFTYKSTRLYESRIKFRVITDNVDSMELVNKLMTGITATDYRNDLCPSLAFDTASTKHKTFRLKNNGVPLAIEEIMASIRYEQTFEFKIPWFNEVETEVVVDGSSTKKSVVSATITTK